MAKEFQSDFHSARQERHKIICDKLRAIYTKKNKDYGDSFVVSIQKFGPIAFVVRASDKMLRIEQLVDNNPEVKDESFEDTVLDLANYCIMYLMGGVELDG